MMGKLVVIDDRNWRAYLSASITRDWHRGLVPRDYRTHPIGFYAHAKPLPASLLIPRNEWRDRLEQQKRDKARLIDVRNRGMNGQPIPTRDQNGRGYCWAHSTVSCAMLARATQGEPYADLSAYAVACIIKNYRDQGGWGAESLEFIAERGVPTSAFWPQQSTDRSNDNSATWDDATKHKIVEWFDLESRDLDQFVSCLLHGFPIVSDFNWWSHSVATMCLENVGDGVKDLETWILNSWGDNWSDNGAGILKGQKALPDDAIAAFVTTSSEK